MEAAASPLPNDDTTPPVTKMYLVVPPDGLVMCLFTVLCCVRLRRTLVSRRSRRRADQPPHIFEILRRIDMNRVVRRLDRLDPDAVLEGAKLLERLGTFERRGLEGGQHQQRAAAIRVEADMFVERRPPAPRIAGVGDGRARAIERKA